MSIESSAKTLNMYLTEYTTYESYLVKCANSGQTPITSDQWDVICDIAGNKKMIYHSSVVQAKKNLEEAFNSN